MYGLGLEILNILFSHKFRGFIVGGFPRDMYLGKESKDIDIATNATYDDLVKIFNTVKLCGNNNFMSYVLYYKGSTFQITTFRKDISYENNRKPIEQIKVDTIEEDLLRRDFIINTLCIDKDGKYVDIMGAMKDMDNKIIRTVNNPDISFKEDALRMLRCIRFATVLGFDIDSKTKEAIINNKDLIRNLSPFRRKQELDKIFSDINYQKGLDLIKELSLEEVLSIKIGNNIYGDNYLLIWSQIEFSDDYPFTREEKRIISRNREYTYTR